MKSHKVKIKNVNNLFYLGLLLFIFLIPKNLVGQNEQWVEFTNGANGLIFDLVYDSQGNLYATGEFTEIGGVAANFIAMYDGVTWSPLGAGLNNRAEAIVIDSDDNVYVGGSFTSPGNYIAMWDGTSWSPLGNGTNRGIRGLTVDNNDNVYAVGVFTSPGKRIAMWDGASWSALSTCLLYTSPSPRDATLSRMPSSA